MCLSSLWSCSEDVYYTLCKLAQFVESSRKWICQRKQQPKKIKNKNNYNLSANVFTVLGCKSVCKCGK